MEAERPVGRARDANAWADNDFFGAHRLTGQDEQWRLREIMAIDRSVDGESIGKFSGPAGNETIGTVRLMGPAPCAHGIDTA